MPFHVSFAKQHCYAGSGDSITLPVVLSAGQERVDLVASLDTGSAYCVFHFSEPTPSPLASMSNAGSDDLRNSEQPFEAYGHEVTVSTLDLEVHSLVFFFGDANIVKNVLGRHGWLDRLTVGIVDYDQLLYLGAYRAFPE